MANPVPPDCGERTNVVAAALGVIRIVDEHGCTAEVRARDWSVVPAVDRVISVVAHHEKGPGGNDERSPLMEAGSRGGSAKSRAANLDAMLPGEDRLWLARDGVWQNQQVGR